VHPQPMKRRRPIPEGGSWEWVLIAMAVRLSQGGVDCRAGKLTRRETNGPGN